jgi:aryl-alcohol dehydrogenase-like predicted oxidoreductase
MSSSLTKYRLLGRSGLRVSPLCLGTMTFGTQWGWGSPEEEARDILNRYLELGGNFVDTANFYTGGTSETMLGKFLEGRRDQVVLATKFTLSMRDGDPNASGNGRKNIVQSCEASLRRLKTDYIDLYIMHAWDGITPAEEILAALHALVMQGKVLHIGVSDTPAWKVAQAQTLADWRGWDRFCSLQIKYALTERTVERELIPMAREMGLGVTPWSPLDGGFLSGKYAPEDAEKKSDSAPAADRRLKAESLRERFDDRNERILAELRAVGHEAARSCAQVALNWVQNRPGVASTIIGARRMDQLEDNLAALDFDLSPEQRERLDKISAVDLGFPGDFLSKEPVRKIVSGGCEVVAPKL